MSKAETVRAWKDPEYRSTLGSIPEHPAGLIELADPDLGGSAVKGGGFRAEALMGTTFSTKDHCCRTVTHPSGLCCK
jgi:mersacidin/lichenicidin family type 2 lantibiotic